MYESKQTGCSPKPTSELRGLISIRSVSQGPVSPIFIICKEAQTVTSEMINMPPISAAEVLSSFNPNDQTTGVYMLRSNSSPMVAFVNLQKTSLKDKRFWSF